MKQQRWTDTKTLVAGFFRLGWLNHRDCTTLRHVGQPTLCAESKLSDKWQLQDGKKICQIAITIISNGWVNNSANQHPCRNMREEKKKWPVLYNYAQHRTLRRRSINNVSCLFFFTRWNNLLLTHCANKCNYKSKETAQSTLLSKSDG